MIFGAEWRRVVYWNSDNRATLAQGEHMAPIAKDVTFEVVGMNEDGTFTTSAPWGAGNPYARRVVPRRTRPR